jgi:S1-C subfamily serine protease
VTTLDWIIIAFAALLALRGFRLGLVAGVLSLVGVLAGLYAGSRIASFLLSGGLSPVYGTLIPMFAVLVTAFLGEAIARALGDRLRRPILGTPLEPLDRLGGAILGAAIALVLAWVVGIVGQQAPLPPSFHASLQRSEIVDRLDERLPSRVLLQAYSRLDPLPQLEGPRPEVPAPDPDLLDDPGVRQAAPSVVRVLSASGVSGSAGSGWVAASELVVTNAHVIADAEYVVVQPEGVGEQLEAEVLIFDELNDLAVLGVEGLDLPALELAVAEPGEPVAVLGYPENGPFDVRAGRVGQTQRVLTSDIRGRGPVERQITVLRSQVSRGNSGGPAVNADGQVVATVFAEGVGAEGVAYGIPSPVVEEAIRAAEQQRARSATIG